ncbi:MAG: TRAP transporter substrate-binding protein DctP [Defluviitaleaceae bacterium]|nr:TRAP transporter substrate-binding protein DctP [Defluviitaleaceae bacterium]
MYKKFIGILSVLTSAIVLSSCGTGVRDRGDLPQSTRIDRDIVVAASRNITVTPIDSADTTTPSAAIESTIWQTRPDGVIEFNLAHQLAPTHPMAIGLTRFQQEVELRSGGSLIVNLHGEGRVAVDSPLVGLINNNELDAALITIWGVWHTLDDMANLESLPWKFTTYEEAFAAYEGTWGEFVAREIIEPHGGKVLGFFTNGLRHFTNNVRPIYTPADMVGLRMRSPNIATNIAMYDLLGSASIMMGFDVLPAALVDGTVDGQDNPLGNIYISRLHDVQRYISLSNHMFSSAPVIVSTDFWNYLSQEHRDILVESALDAARFQGELTVSMEDQMLSSMQADGAQVNNVNLSAFMTAVEPIWTDHVSRFGVEFADILSRYITDPNSPVHRHATVTTATPNEEENDVEEYNYENYEEDGEI